MANALNTPSAAFVFVGFSVFVALVALVFCSCADASVLSLTSFVLVVAANVDARPVADVNVVPTVDACHQLKFKQHARKHVTVHDDI
jgi:hypothetical protein